VLCYNVRFFDAARNRKNDLLNEYVKLNQMKAKISAILLLFLCLHNFASQIIIPMDKTQSNHLKAYGITYWWLEKGGNAEWLLNYKGGSFSFLYHKDIESELVIRDISYKILSDADYAGIKEELASPNVNADVLELKKAPKIAVYSPKTKQPWDDAVTMVLTYAEIPYDVIFDDEVLTQTLPKYDWLHLHHEDFTGQYGKFYRSFSRAPWYIEQKKMFEASAAKHGFKKVSELKLAIVKEIQAFCASGGFLFAMCSATDTYDIALSAEGIDICEHMFDGDGADPHAQHKLDYSKTFAFKDFSLIQNPMEYEYSSIDNQYADRGLNESNDYFTLFDFSAKWDPVPTILTQNHTRVVKGFMGQTTAYKKKMIKKDVIILGQNAEIDEARYIHGTFGKGFWTFYGGHDPEDYQHYVGEQPTDLNLHPNSPGYRLILNNILFPSAKKKKKKT